MASSLTVITPPAVEPVSRDLARQFARIDQLSDDVILDALIASARIYAERYLSRALITQTLQYTLMPEPPIRPMWHYMQGPIVLTRAPVQSIVSIIVTDTNGAVTTVPAATLPVVPPTPLSGYIPRLGVTPAEVKIGDMTLLSDGRYYRHTPFASIAVQFVAGYGNAATAVPKNIINAILMLVAFLYEHRGDADVAMPKAVEVLLDQDRIMWV